jgi:hypothetical protein
MRNSRKKSGQVKQHALTPRSLTVSSPELGRPTLTVGQIVEQLGAVTADSRATTTERIRHWTREGLLVPVDQHHAGTGRHRGYGSDISYEAAVLDTLASAGLHLVSRPYIQTVLSHARAALRDWRQAITAGQKPPLFFLVISHEKRIGSEPTVSIHEGGVKDAATAEIMILVNLSQLFWGVLSRASQP